MAHQHLVTSLRDASQDISPLVAKIERDDKTAGSQITEKVLPPIRPAAHVTKQPWDVTKTEGDGTSTGVIINKTRDMLTISLVLVTISTLLVTGKGPVESAEAAQDLS